MKRVMLAMLAAVLCTGIGFCTDVYGSVGQKVPILLYHHIVAENEAEFYADNDAVITLAEFEEQMEYLYMNGFHAVTIQEMQDFLYKGKKLPEKSVMLTFDDGYYSNIVYAYPVLEKYSFRATLFLITGAVDEEQHPYTENRLVFIAKESMEGTQHVFEYASHTHLMHADMGEAGGPTILASSSKDEIMEDIKKSFEYTKSKKIFAYPKGQYNEEIIEALMELGVTMAVTVEPGYISYGDSYGYKLNRFIIPKNIGMGRFIQIVEGKAGK